MTLKVPIIARLSEIAFCAISALEQMHWCGGLFDIRGQM
jgi:hypothetical protein